MSNLTPQDYTLKVSLETVRHMNFSSLRTKTEVDLDLSLEVNLEVNPEVILRWKSQG
jgi:hypothetical protein